MVAPMSYLATCDICKKPVKLELAKTDELGRTVHEGCYLLKLHSQPTIQRKA
jgi:hypothetical protein